MTGMTTVRRCCRSRLTIDGLVVQTTGDVESDGRPGCGSAEDWDMVACSTDDVEAGGRPGCGSAEDWDMVTCSTDDVETGICPMSCQRILSG